MGVEEEDGRDWSCAGGGGGVEEVWLRDDPLAGGIIGSVASGTTLVWTRRLGPTGCGLELDVEAACD